MFDPAFFFWGGEKGEQMWLCVKGSSCLRKFRSNLKIPASCSSEGCFVARKKKAFGGGGKPCVLTPNVIRIWYYNEQGNKQILRYRMYQWEYLLLKSLQQQTKIEFHYTHTMYHPKTVVKIVTLAAIVNILSQSWFQDEPFLPACMLEIVCIYLPPGIDARNCNIYI